MRFLIRSFFRLAKKDSATALSQQFPRLLMLGSSRLVREISREEYGQMKSEIAKP
jgi:hypothetical protein